MKILNHKHEVIIELLFLFIVACFATIFFPRAFRIYFLSTLLLFIIIILLALNEKVRIFYLVALKKIKDYHIKLCIAILMLISLFMFCSGFISGGTTQHIPWWFALLYGWSGLVVAYKLGKFWYKD